MLLVNRLTKEALPIAPVTWELVLQAAREYGWAPTGTTNVDVRLAHAWHGGRANYINVGAVIAPADALALAVALRAAWGALVNGERGRGLGVTDWRLITGQAGTPQPLETLRNSSHDARGGLWAAAAFVAKGGAIEICEHGDERLAVASVRMRGGVHWHGQILGRGEVVELPLAEAGAFVASGRAFDEVRTGA